MTSFFRAIRFATSNPSEATFFLMSAAVSSKVINTPGSLYWVMPRIRNSVARRDLPQPAEPQTSVGRPAGRPPPVISSKPLMPVGTFFKRLEDTSRVGFFIVERFNDFRTKARTMCLRGVKSFFAKCEFALESLFKPFRAECLIRTLEDGSLNEQLSFRQHKEKKRAAAATRLVAAVTALQFHQALHDWQAQSVRRIRFVQRVKRLEQLPQFVISNARPVVRNPETESALYLSPSDFEPGVFPGMLQCIGNEVPPHHFQPVGNT